ncbi:hypothetical protein P154DRAFT_573502 [Amniculicola lignicola CBS 123094]|uniref:Uncharacterized protein n=1 Tax=Amniculicola lignicola CBS 123094 TaxID=1392246 RepID=A0A6A5WVJ9_9PLEO|nr:hypothetical protein P154DRAFT_573502 [Amniculicola lignicola CBS 123094]
MSFPFFSLFSPTTHLPILLPLFLPPLLTLLTLLHTTLTRLTPSLLPAWSCNTLPQLSLYLTLDWSICQVLASGMWSVGLGVFLSCLSKIERGGGGGGGGGETGKEESPEEEEEDKRKMLEFVVSLLEPGKAGERIERWGLGRSHQGRAGMRYQQAYRLCVRWVMVSILGVGIWATLCWVLRRRMKKEQNKDRDEEEKAERGNESEIAKYYT